MRVQPFGSQSQGSGGRRYANVEASYLLQALEAHEGLVLVTTNAKHQIDRAFLRRFDVAVEFHCYRPGGVITSGPAKVIQAGSAKVIRFRPAKVIRGLRSELRRRL